ncbi:hypothetical protein [uncultured Legionella sp.]|uniref:hypothetical protein n=1 Tax=uncultured Legionella sp. TaxID=210934 RepID=UPI002614EBDD|nr:hypothetical protein [uncultured Legionella sp.]
MHVHIGRSENYLESIEVVDVSKHKILPHISKLLSSHDKNQYLNRINKIHIENSNFNQADYHALERILHECTYLEKIELNSNHIDTTPCSNLFDALLGKKLSAISLTDNWIGPKLPKNYFDFFATQTEITSICFSLNWLGDTGIVMFMESLKKSVRELELSCNDFYLNGMMAIRNFVKECNFLSLLDISYNLIDSKLAKQIGCIIQEARSLACLNINSNQIGDQGAFLIADALKNNRSIVSLNIADNKISFTGAQYLMDSIRNGAIKQLDLRHNCLNPEEKQHLTSQAPREIKILI